MSASELIGSISDMSFSIACRRRPRNTTAIMLLGASSCLLCRADRERRLWEPLNLRVSKNSHCLEYPVHRLEVLAVRGSKLKPILFQDDVVLPTCWSPFPGKTRSTITIPMNRK